MGDSYIFIIVREPLRIIFLPKKHETMKTLNKILVPVDFSGRSVQALGQAVDLAKKSGARLYIFHVFARPVVPEMAGGSKQDLKQAENTLLARKERSIDEGFENLHLLVPELANVPHEFSKSIGQSVAGIIEKANQLGVDLLIMATKGARGLNELWGSKTSKVVKEVHCPTLVLPDGSSLAQLSKIGFAVDYHEAYDPRSLSVLVPVAKAYQAEIHVINIAKNPETRSEREFEEAVKIHEAFAEVAHSFDYIFEKNVEKSMVNYCKNTGIGLLALVPHPRNFVTGFFKESLTNLMVNHTDFPLLVIR
jgi:nucleotide-binding universal stress UspA family protein